jgi:hypothetical protein
VSGDPMQTMDGLVAALNIRNFSPEAHTAGTLHYASQSIVGYVSASALTACS